MKLQYAAISLRGTHHEANEDRALVGMRSLPPESDAVVCGEDEASRAFIVFDGVGGHGGGAQAAGAALAGFSLACAQAGLQPGNAGNAMRTPPSTRQPGKPIEESEDTPGSHRSPDHRDEHGYAHALVPENLAPNMHDFATLSEEGHASYEGEHSPEQGSHAPEQGGHAPGQGGHASEQEIHAPEQEAAAWRGKLACVLRSANDAILEARHRGERIGFCAAAGVAFDEQGRAHTFHSGDVRAYRYRAPYAMRLTHDHSLAEQWRDEHPGQPVPDDIAHTITRSLGHPVPGAHINDRAWPFDLANPMPIANGDIYAVCSDGIWEYIAEEDFEQALDGVASPAGLADALSAIATDARERGSYDDATIIAVRVAEQCDE